MSPLALFHALVAPVLTGLALHAVLNDRRWPRLEERPGSAPGPSVSILIPARNEAARIAGAVRSWVRQDYPVHEVLVYDDASTDDTRQRVLRLRAARRHVRVIRGDGLPPGWRGKPHACDRLRARAAGEILVFADADVRAAPGAVAAAVRALDTLQVDALSAITAHRGGGPMMRLLLGLQNWAPLAFLPLWLPAAARHPLFAAANGQFLAIRAAAYDAAGGFASVKDALGEDAAFGRRLVRLGFRLRLVDGTPLLGCRGYSSTRALWHANTRNLLPVFFGSAALLLALGAALVGLYVVPPLLLVAAAAGAWAPPAAGVGLLFAECALGLLPRWLADRRARYPAPLFLAHPLAVAALVAMSLESLVRWRWRRRLEWRGRGYDVGERVA